MKASDAFREDAPLPRVALDTLRYLDAKTLCGHRSPLNYDRTRYAMCALPEGHVGNHRDAHREWTPASMPWRAVSSASTRKDKP